MRVIWQGKAVKSGKNGKKFLGTRMIAMIAPANTVQTSWHHMQFAAVSEADRE